MNKQYHVYITTNPGNTVLYTGVTSDIKKRVFQHMQRLTPGFTTRYNVTKLVYFEVFENAYDAISREKQLKAGSRQKKIDLINSMNSQWRDLYEEL